MPAALTFGACPRPIAQPGFITLLATLTRSLVAFLILGSVAHAGLLNAVKQRGTLRIAVEGTYPPFNFKEKGQLAGFEVELAKALASKMGVKDAAYRAVPSLSNSLIKDTSLVSVIAVSELMLATREAIATTFQPFPLYIAAAAI